VLALRGQPSQTVFYSLENKTVHWHIFKPISGKYMQSGLESKGIIIFTMLVFFKVILIITLNTAESRA
jgi:hypothetical protein